MHPELLLLIGISLSLGFTPGPNNAVAAYSGFNFGIRKTLPLILGVGFGYTALIILINFVLISAAFFEVITFSLAAGIRTSHFLFSKRLPSLTKLPLG